MKWLIIGAVALGFLSISIPGFSQDYTHFSFDTTSSVAFMRHMQDASPTSDGGAICLGFNELGMLLVKLDDLGDFEWGKQFTTAFSYNVYGAEELSPGRYRILSEVISALPQRPFMFDYDATMDSILQFQVYDNFRFNRQATMALTPDGGFVMVNGVQNGPNNVTKLDSLGLIEWQHSYLPSLANGRNYAIDTWNGGYMVAGFVSTNQNDAVIYNLDFDGNVIWYKAFTGNQTDETIDVITYPNGEAFILGNTNSTGMGGTDIFILKLDGQGQIEWFRTYGTPGDETANSFMLTSDNSLVVVGKQGQTKGSDMLLFKTDIEGVLKWSYTADGQLPDTATADQANGIAELGSGLYAMANNADGASLTIIDTAGNGLCNRTDAELNMVTHNGFTLDAVVAQRDTFDYHANTGFRPFGFDTIVNPIPICEGDSLIIIPPDTINAIEVVGESAVQLFPNPNNGSFTLKTDQPIVGPILIYNAVGQLIEQIDPEPGALIHQMQLQTFSKGLHLLVFSLNNRRVRKSFWVE